MASSKWGCFLRFQWDAELADAYYYEHYNNTNKTMLLISPLIPMRHESFKKLYKIYTSNPMIWMTWMYYRPGLLKEVYQQGDISFIWKVSGVDMRMAFVAALVTTLIGVFGEYHS